MSDPTIFKRGMLGYATILAALRDQPMTTDALGAKFGMVGNTLRVIMRQLHHRGLVRIAGWEIRPVKHHAVAVWGFGPEVDVPAPPRREGAPRSRRDYGAPKPRVEMMSFAAIMALLAEPHTAKAICEETGLCHQTVYKLLAHMKALRLVRVAMWDRTIALAPVQAFQLGDRRDADRPRPRDRIEVWRAYEVRRRARAKTVRMTHLMASPLAQARAS